MIAPTTAVDFDRAYRSPVSLWGDIRRPAEVRKLAHQTPFGRCLELGCGVGRLSHFMAQQGLEATGVDFSPVAIAKAKERVAKDDRRPEFLVGDVTDLNALSGPFDLCFDVGCFHCLGPEARASYVSAVSRLLRSGGTHLIWALDASPSGTPLSPLVIEEMFARNFKLGDARTSRRRLARSHWYWLIRA